VKTLHYTLTFNTPAFLGNADQNGQWRTPPIKALLRQWWRVAYAADKNFNVSLEEMRYEEGILFGHAWLENDSFNRLGKTVKTKARKSEIRIRLAMPDGQSGDAWGKGTLKGEQVVALLSTELDANYAWFGLVNRGKGQPDRKAIAIKPNENRRDLFLALPDKHAGCIQTTMQLIHQFGQLGARSRGGWGSLSLEGINPLTTEQMLRHAQILNDCLRFDWPISLCKDHKGLCLWQSQDTFSSWDKAIQAIATERKNTRTSLKRINGHDLRPVLGFGAPKRMPSPLRWRVVPATSGQWAIQVFAMPTQIPEEGQQNINKDQAFNAWEKVIQTLDSSKMFKPRGGQ